MHDKADKIQKNKEFYCVYDICWNWKGYLKNVKRWKNCKARDLHIITFYGNHQDRSLNFK